MKEVVIVSATRTPIGAFQGVLAPGASAEGVYVVRVPKDARSDVTVEVGYQAGAPLLIFNGSVD